MNTVNREDFCTIFDSSFLVLGLAMYRSLKKALPDARLWILAMDTAAEQTLVDLELKDVFVIPLQALETEELLKVKNSRSNGEYCWTLSPYFPWWLLTTKRIERQVTYVDADLYFYSSPERIFSEFRESKKSVLITEHAYDPQYDQSETCGRFCVQFMTFKNNQDGLRVLEWWRNRCIEWCYARFEDGKFGDQKYLDSWPDQFREEVHILKDKYLALAPWNVSYVLKRDSKLVPVFYHFHGLRFFSEKKVLLFRGYKIYSNARSRFYLPYLKEIASLREILPSFRVNIPKLARRSLKTRIRDFQFLCTHRQYEARL